MYICVQLQYKNYFPLVLIVCDVIKKCFVFFLEKFEISYVFLNFRFMFPQDLEGFQKPHYA